MNLPVVSLADLLRALAGVASAEQAAAAQAAGYALRPAGAAPPPVPAPDLQLPPPQPHPPVSPPLPEPPPLQGDERPRHWRLAAVQPDNAPPPQRPAWLDAQPGWPDFVSNPAIPAPPPLHLAGPARAAAVLRRALVQPRPGPGVDAQAVARAWSRGRVLRRLPRPLQRRWPARLQVVLDLSPRQAPLDTELLAWWQPLQRLLRGRVQLQVVSGLPYCSDAQGRLLLPLALDGSPVLVLGDLGLYDTLAQPERGPVHRAWVELLAEAAQAGSSVTVLAPLPRRLAAASQARSARLWWVDDAGVHPPLPGLPTATATATRPGQAPDGDLPALLGALHGNTHVPASLLRRLRLALAQAGHALDLGDEVALWRHPAVRATPIACRTEPDSLPAARAAWLALTPAQRASLAALHWPQLLAGSPLVRAEYAQTLLGELDSHSPIGATLAQGRHDAERLMQRAAAAQGQGDGPPQLAGQLADYLRGQSLRQPELLRLAGDGWSMAWALAHQQQLLDPATPPPPWARPEHLQWLQPATPAAQPAQLRQRGVALVWSAPVPSAPALALASVAPLWSARTLPAEPGAARAAAVQALPLRQRVALLRRQCLVAAMQPTGKARFQAIRANQANLFSHSAKQQAPAQSKDDPAGDPGWLIDSLCSLADELAADPERFALQFDGGLRRLATTQHVNLGLMLTGLDQALGIAPPAAAQPLTLRPGQPLPLPAGPNRLQLHTGTQGLTLEPFTRPPWADALQHTATGWWASLPDGRQLRWLPQAAMPVLAGQGLPHYTPPQGFWWDAAEAEANFFAHGGQLRQPGWAARHGVDGFGWWAEFDLPAYPGAARQPPAMLTQRLRFIPPGRFWMGSPGAEAGREDHETLHPVTLTRGLWLADTACSAALWRAVVGDAGKAPETTADGQPLPQVEISHDDITGRFLPTLACCLPGFEGRLPTEAEWEYAARAGTTTAYTWGDEADGQRLNIGSAVGPLQAFERNAFGLWQVHGNVWEWCADGFQPLPADEALDPVPPESAWRVLRGGSWLDLARLCRSAMRNLVGPGGRSRYFGFRLARGLPQAQFPAGGARPAEPRARVIEPAARDPGSGAPESAGQRQPPGDPGLLTRLGSWLRGDSQPPAPPPAPQTKPKPEPKPDKK